MKDGENLYQLQHRLNELLPALKSPETLKNTGKGNEIGFYIFDYPPEAEMLVRRHVKKLIEELNPTVRAREIDLFALVVSILKSRNLLEQAIKAQKEKGDDFLRKALAPPLHESKIAGAFVETARLEDHDLIFVTGVGSAFPLVRSHALLNNLHSLMRDTPLILFYPGSFDGQFLTLFNLLKTKDYYRAFRLAS